MHSKRDISANNWLNKLDVDITRATVGLISFQIIRRWPSFSELTSMPNQQSVFLVGLGPLRTKSHTVLKGEND